MSVPAILAALLFPKVLVGVTPPPEEPAEGVGAWLYLTRRGSVNVMIIWYRLVREAWVVVVVKHALH